MARSIHTAPDGRQAVGRRRAGRGLLVGIAGLGAVLAACGGVDASKSTTTVAAPTTAAATTTAAPATTTGAAATTAPGSATSVASATTEAAATTAAPTTTAAPATTATPVSGGSITVAIDADASGYAPQTDAWGTGGHDVARAIFDTLATYDAQGKTVPYLAKSITANADSTVWTITLRPGVLFHDGEKFDAGAVKANLEAVKASPTFKTTLDLLASIKVVDDLTVVLTMSKPWGAFPNVLSGGFGGQAGYMAAPKMLKDPNGGRHPIGTGPFKFVEWVPDDHLTVARNDAYWQKPAYLDQVVFKPIADSQARKTAFDAGDVDLYFTGSSKELGEYLAQQAQGKVHVTQAPPSDPDVLVLNTKKAPLDDVRVRKAMQLSVDFGRLFDFLEGTGVKQIMHGPYPDSSFWYVPTGYPEFNLDQAKALVQEYVAEKGPITFDYIGNQDPFVVSYMELIQSMWKDAGIDANIVSKAQGDIISSVLGGDYQVAGWGGIGADDPDNDYAFFHSGGTVLTGFTDPKIDAAMEAGRALSDPEARKQQYGIVQQILTDNMPYIWMGTVQFGVVTQAKVIGLDAFTLPDGSPGRPLTGARFFLKDVWIQK
jgi:peptide/nickel transport system substrate-binding protein